MIATVLDFIITNFISRINYYILMSYSCMIFLNHVFNFGLLITLQYKKNIELDKYFIIKSNNIY